jgi:hypothetical protein
VVSTADPLWSLISRTKIHEITVICTVSCLNTMTSVVLPFAEEKLYRSVITL